ncbi:hypothetical protein [Spirosoma endophyticum]|uniref:hypothetical protein n=1 Tax=Spirosoma endophyticum TaxID=662367 RepID=UPI0015A60320|nr:hypothetical protein [Spirosoma endophyticum]
MMKHVVLVIADHGHPVLFRYVLVNGMLSFQRQQHQTAQGGIGGVRPAGHWGWQPTA